MNLPQSKNICFKIGHCAHLFLGGRLALKRGASEEGSEVGRKKRPSFFVPPPPIFSLLTKEKKKEIHEKLMQDANLIFQ